MKIRVLFCVLFFVLSYANAHFLVGLRNQRYIFWGYENDGYGLIFEESLFNQDLELQHGRIALFREYQVLPNVDVEFSFWGGMEYDFAFYDFGSHFLLKWNIYSNRVFFDGCIQPMYDNEIKENLNYGIQLMLKPFDEIGIFGGVKSIPDYRKPEDRYLFGALFDVDRLKVSAEISTPIQGSFEWTRISTNFIYRTR